MHSAAYVDNLITTLKAQGVPLSDIAWQAALACVGMPYIFGNRGQFCTPSNRRAAYNRTAEGKNKDNIRNRCQNFDGSKPCSGCKWYPVGEKVRSWDCRGFTYWILLQVYGWKLMGAGCTTQWNNKSNWKAQGEIKDGIPQNTIVCLFYYKKDSKGRRTSTLEHTGLYYNGQTVECSAGVQHSTTLNKKWEVWGVPACVDAIGELSPVETGKDEPKMAILKKGSRGAAVKELQTLLNAHGFDCGTADGIFGDKTEKAVRACQATYGLTVDGVAGVKTLAVLQATTPVQPKPQPEPTPQPAPTVDVDAIKAYIKAIRAELDELEKLVSA